LKGCWIHGNSGEAYAGSTVFRTPGHAPHGAGKKGVENTMVAERAGVRTKFEQNRIRSQDFDVETAQKMQIRDGYPLTIRAANACKVKP
jgi:hypothetical protein